MKNIIVSFLFFYALFMNVVTNSQKEFCRDGFVGGVLYTSYIFPFDSRPCTSDSCGDFCLDKLPPKSDIGYSGCHCGNWCICCIT
ncbi:hypothetical protein Hanom_Chr03g00184711 [Helianthus anomalus]